MKGDKEISGFGGLGVGSWELGIGIREREGRRRERKPGKAKDEIPFDNEAWGWEGRFWKFLLAVFELPYTKFYSDAQCYENKNYANQFTLVSVDDRGQEATPRKVSLPRVFQRSTDIGIPMFSEPGHWAEISQSQCLHEAYIL